MLDDEFEAWLSSPPPGPGRKPKGLPKYQLPVISRSGARGGNPASHLPVVFHAMSLNRKLAPVEMMDEGADRPRPQALGPHCSSTYVSIEHTCPESCEFKRAEDGGPGACFVQAGFTRHATTRMDRDGGRFTSLQISRIEARCIDLQFPEGVPQDGAKGGRDLRMHVGGETSCTNGAHILARSALGWKGRGGGAVWLYTHRWREIPPEAFGTIEAWASLEDPQDIQAARELGYLISFTVTHFPRGHRPFWFGDLEVTPCPAETRGRTCVQCRLCLEPPKAYREGRKAIGFMLHGNGMAKVLLRLMELQDQAMIRGLQRGRSCESSSPSQDHHGHGSAEG